MAALSLQWVSLICFDFINVRTSTTSHFPHQRVHTCRFLIDPCALVTCGAGWRSDYGDPDVEDNFKYLYAYSPYHNVPANEHTPRFPKLMLTTGDHDDRVVPLHSYKHMAALQHALALQGRTEPTESERVLLIRIETKAGHGAGKPTSKIIEEYVDVYAFMAASLGCTYTP